MQSAAEAVVRLFIERVNAHDPNGIVGLCTPDHVFIDSLGSRLSGGPEKLSRAWHGYFALFPDYRVEVSVLVSSGPVVAAFGAASGTLAGTAHAGRAFWSIPAAWRALVHDGLIAEWQVYADNKPVYEILASANT